MKHLVAQARKASNKIAMVFTMMLISFLSFAQDKKVDIDINTKGENDNFFMQPWVWVVGGAVFLLLLVALLRSNSSNK